MENKLRILAINPNSDVTTCRRMEATIRAFADGDYEVDVEYLRSAPRLIASFEDRIVAVDELCQLVRRSEIAYDAFIIACHADPNLDLVREITTRPVVGIGEASMKIAASMGSGFAVLSPSIKTQSRKFALAHSYHLSELLKGVIVSAGDSPEELLAAAREAVKIPCVDAIVLGCANYTGADGYIERHLGIPVIDGFACALFLAAGLARYQQYKERTAGAEATDPDRRDTVS